MLFSWRCAGSMNVNVDLLQHSQKVRVYRTKPRETHRNKKTMHTHELYLSPDCCHDACHPTMWGMSFDADRSRKSALPTKKSDAKGKTCTIGIRYFFAPHIYNAVSIRNGRSEAATKKHTHRGVSDLGASVTSKKWFLPFYHRKRLIPSRLSLKCSSTGDESGQVGLCQTDSTIALPPKKELFFNEGLVDARHEEECDGK